jgi:dipeptidyl aminopeptidase/acylaminoacyl peptidase
MSFIDAERVAVTGVSYGGYVAGLMLADRSKDVLACGVAVTPVVDWRFYGIDTKISSPTTP